MEYAKYLLTDHWKAVAEETKRLAGYRCQVCNSPDNLNAHHRTYDRIGNELQSDLVCLCEKCHHLFHEHKGSIPIHEITDSIKFENEQAKKRVTNMRNTWERYVYAGKKSSGMTKEQADKLTELYTKYGILLRPMFDKWFGLE